MSSTHKVSLGRVEIESTIISTIPQLNDCLNKLISTIVKHPGTGGESHRAVVGLNMEKMFVDAPYSQVRVCEKLAILSLCHGKTCLIIQLHRMSSSPKSLSGFLQLPWLTFVGVGIAHCLEALDRDYGVKCRNAMDLGQTQMANPDTTQRFRGHSLFDLVGTQLRGLSDTEATDCLSLAALSDWGVEILSDYQIRAANWATFLSFYKGFQLLGGQGCPSQI